MKKIVAAIALDGNVVDKSDYFNDYPFTRLVDFQKDQLTIHNHYKMKTEDYKDFIATIPYDSIKEMSLKIVRRIKGQRITLINPYYDFDLYICTKEMDEWNIETEAIYQIIDGLNRIDGFKDIVGVFDQFRSAEQFYDSNEEELKRLKGVNVHRNAAKKDFQKYCDEYYDEWVQKFGFEKGRFTYPDRNI